MSLTDERVIFYLRNQARIEEWAAIRTEAAATIDVWLSELGQPIEALGKEQEMGGNVDFLADTNAETAWPLIKLGRPAWNAGQAGVDVAVALQWARGRTTLHGNNLPYVGVIAPQARPLGSALRASLDVRELRKNRKELTSIYWVAYHYVAPPPEFWTIAAQDSYREQLLRAVGETWLAYAPIIDRLALTM